MSDKKMIVWISLKEGIRNVWEHKVLALLLFLFKLFFAFLFLIPAYYMFSRTFSFSPLAVNFLKGYDFYLLVDFLSGWDEGLGIYKGYFLIVGFGLLLFYIFFSGGLWGALYQSSKQEGYRLSGEKFFTDCGRYYVSFLKIFIFIFIVYILILIFALFIFSSIRALTGKELSYTAHVLIFFLEILVMAILFMWMDMWSYYMRAKRVLFEEKKLITLLRSSLGFIFKNFGKTISLYYILSLTLLGTLAVYGGLNKLLHLLPAGKLQVLSLFILYQSYSFFRSFYKLGYYSSHMVLLDKLYDFK